MSILRAGGQRERWRCPRFEEKSDKGDVKKEEVDERSLVSKAEESTTTRTGTSGGGGTRRELEVVYWGVVGPWEKGGEKAGHGGKKGGLRGRRRKGGRKVSSERFAQRSLRLGHLAVT